MIRKLAFAVAMLGLVFSSLANALGLGEAEVKSSLNQPLRAEIELVSVKGLQENEILPGLATREEFLKANVDRVYFLSDLRFEVERNSAGKMVVVLTTNKPVREPFLNFLVEVIWPSGRLLREYALLIDPPLFSQEPAAPVASPVASAPRQVAGDRVAMPAPTPVRQTTTAPVSDTYGPTNSRDTLWDIAAKVRPNRSVSPQQVMLAIQDLNPQAFIGNNINRLKEGQVLRLPTLDQIKARSSASAINEVIAQNQALQPKKSKPVVSAAQSQQPAKPASRAAGGDELKLLVAQNEQSASSTANSGTDAQPGSGAGLDQDMAITLEKLDKANLENKELSGRVEDLEEQLETLQRLLTLKNDQLASLQTQARAAEEEKLKAEMSQAQTEDAAAEMPADETMTEDDAASATVADSDAMVEDEEVADESSEMAEAEMKPEPVQPKVVEAEKPVPAPVPAKPVQPSQSIFDLILNNPLYQGAVAAGLVVLLLILWFISKQNAKREQEVHSEEQEFAEEEYEEEYTEEDTEFAEDLEEDLEPEEELSEAAESEGGDKTADSEDVIAEADVYIAYGRLDQAASVLEQGISSDPVRADYRLKLLEVYSETGDVEAFDRQLSELEAIQDPDAMDKALEIKANMQSSGGDESEDSLELGETDFDQDTAGAFEPEDHTEPEESSQSDDLVDDVEEEQAESEPDNSFDFESVSLDEDEDEEEDLGIDLSSEDLEVDLDIDIEKETDNSIDYEPESLDEAETESLDDEIQESQDDLAALADADASTLELDDEEVETEEVDASALDLDVDEPESATEDDEALDLELGDLELSDELEQESEIELPDDLSLPDEVLDLDQEDAETEAEVDDEVDVAAEISEALAEDAEVEDKAELDEVAEEVDEVDTSVEETEPETDEAPEDAVVSDDILDEAVEALSEGDDLDSELGEDEDFDFLNGTDEASTKLDLARAYIDMGDVDGARDILQEVEKEGSEEQQAEAKDLLGSLDK